MQHPDLSLTSHIWIGQVWRLESSMGRIGSNGMDWVEDLEWARRLDECWNLNTARKVASKLVSHYSDPGLVKVLDDGSEHQHRLALCVDNSKLQHCAAMMTEAFAKEGLEVPVWQYIRMLLCACDDYPYLLSRNHFNRWSSSIGYIPFSHISPPAGPQYR